MKKIQLFVLVMLAFFIVSCTNTQTKNQESSSKPSVTSGQTSVPVKESSASSVYDIEIRSGGFRPETIEISRGDSVRWTNEDTVDHTITGPTFPMPASTSPRNSGRLQPGQSWTKEFNTEGFYAYYDLYDDSLKGKVIVK